VYPYAPSESRPTKRREKSVAGQKGLDIVRHSWLLCSHGDPHVLIVDGKCAHVPAVVGGGYVLPAVGFEHLQEALCIGAFQPVEYDAVARFSERNLLVGDQQGFDGISYGGS
jgi:hypothetical protein